MLVVGDYSGNYSGIGNSVALGADFVADKIKLGRGKELIIHREDDKGDDIKARKIALKFSLQSSVIAVIGHSSSGNTLSTLDIYGTFKVPLFLPVATNPQITQVSSEKKWDNIYRLVPIDNFQAAKIAEFTKKKISNQNKQSKKSALIIHDETTYGINLGESLEKALSNQEVVFSSISNSDYSQINKSLEEIDSDVIIFAGYYEEGGKLVSDIRKREIKKPIILTDGCFVSKIFDYLGPDSGELYISFLAPDISKIEKVTPLISKIRLSEPDAKFSDLAYAPFGADSIRIIHELSKKILSEKSSITRKELLKCMNNEKNRNFDKNMMIGPYNFNLDGDNIMGRNYIYKLNTNNFNEWIFEE
ncbi:branched-chain amino acid ABC transporter substrate-binding protein [Acaryochloris sp. CCMEE 5410]|uniref:branched-chain amino acid ABC transporter substrate-binding protein n=1 Tax=Acaryochloris sp. CCMEE 5410 TaxID=310037 RepID=UPI0021D019C9|nr:branched-chain amino acid ABC transporter substrate-binding protein [Acaryochloris sp. CCMEE 5410]KAI9135471.1 branched-chain amino acid ABC transporter substrate-binding protein [Acaryochloris sp. CCMEE 5410]